MPPGSPVSVAIFDKASKEHVFFDEIYIDNVYLISGQSNMALTLGDSNDIHPDYPDNLIRHLEIKKQAEINPDHSTFHAERLTANGKNLENFSALYCRLIIASLDKVS